MAAAFRASSTSWFASGEVILCGDTSRPRTSSTSWLAVGVTIEFGVSGVGEEIVFQTVSKCLILAFYCKSLKLIDVESYRVHIGRVDDSGNWLYHVFYDSVSCVAPVVAKVDVSSFSDSVLWSDEYEEETTVESRSVGKSALSSVIAVSAAALSSDVTEEPVNERSSWSASFSTWNADLHSVKQFDNSWLV